MKAFMKWIDDIIVKFHKCEKYEELYSYTFHTDEDGFRRLIGKHTKCALFGRDVEKWDIQP